MEATEIIAKLEQILDARLDPLKNSVESIKIDVNAIKLQVTSSTDRLFKIEERLAKIDSKLDAVKHDFVDFKEAHQAHA